MQFKSIKPEPVKHDVNIRLSWDEATLLKQWLQRAAELSPSVSARGLYYGLVDILEHDITLVNK